MTKRMLIDATHPEETRVAVISGNKLEEYDYETIVRKQLKGNIYLVKVTRVEPSLQAAFVDFGGNRHGFLPFPEIHPDYYRIPIADREALIAEERALAAEQAAREDEEDAAELAAFDGDDGEEAVSFVEDTEDDADDLDAEAYVPQHTGSIAEDIGATEVVDARSSADDMEEDAELEETSAGVAAAADDAVAQAPSEGAADAEEEKDPDVETVGGDVVDQPVYRSSIKRRYKIQEVIKRNQIMLIQISKEERGNKGAAVTSYISLPGRYCVLMPNSPRGGGVSRKVSNAKDRQRLKAILRELNVPEGMSVILRTAGVSRSTAEIKRDLDYLLRLWDQIRELTLKSTAPALIYEEGNLIKRAIRDLYRRDIDEVHVAGEEGFQTARDFMNTLMPAHLSRVHHYKEEEMPLFFRYQVENQIDEIHNPTVHLKSGGYIVINPTEALVSIDVNSGRATKGRHIEETALKTNIEAADEIARQLRLRDQGGLIVIDFIDMEDKRSNRIVEKRLRDAMQNDRARIQLGRISAFGLLELSRQRLHPSLVETNFEVCKHCSGSGLVRTVETSAVMVLRAIGEEGMKARASEIRVSVPAETALYLFNNKREMLANIERRYGIKVFIHADDDMLKPNYKIEVIRQNAVEKSNRPNRQAPVQTVDMSDLPELSAHEITDDSTYSEDESREEGGNLTESADETDGEGRGGRDRDRGGRRRFRDRDRGGRGRDRNRNRGGNRHHQPQAQEGVQPGEGDQLQQQETMQDDTMPVDGAENAHAEGGRDDREGGRRRGRRGGRRRGGRGRDRNRDEQRGGDRQAAGQEGSSPSSDAPYDPQTEQPRESDYRREPSRNTPREEYSAPANSDAGSDMGGQENSGSPRKGWWKRLTE